MDHYGIQKEQEQKFQIEVTQDFYEKQQTAAWDLVSGFSDTASVNTKSGVKYVKYDSLGIADLRDELKKDTDSKSESYTLMYESVDKLLTLSASKGQYTDLNGNAMTASFFDTFYKTKEAVNRYIFTHSGYKWFDKGERRLQLSLRIKSILNEMESQIEGSLRNLSAEEARMIEYKKEGLTQTEIDEREKLVRVNEISADVQKIVEGGNLGSGLSKEESEKLVKTWVAGDYSSYLSAQVDGEKLKDKESKNDYLAFMENKNGCLLANRIAFSMVMDRKSDITLYMPWLRTELEEDVKSRLKDEDMFVKPEKFVEKVNILSADFAERNKDRITEYRGRRDRIFKELKLDGSGKDIYRFSAMKLMITDGDDRLFSERLNDLKTETDKTDALLDGQLEKRFSAATREVIKGNLKKRLGSFRVFGKREQVLVQADMFCGMLAYVSPEEFRVERQISTLMDSLKIEGIHRDAFLKELTLSAPETFKKHDNRFWKNKGSKIAERIHENTKTYLKVIEEKNLMLTKGQWEEIEAKYKNCSSMKKEDFRKSLKRITLSPFSGKKISRREYTSNRDLDDMNALPAVQERARAERKKLEALGTSLEKKFYVHLSGDGKNIYLPYRKMNAAFKGRNSELKVQEKEEEERFNKRKTDIEIALYSKGIHKSQLDRYAEKFRWLMSGIYEITEDMPEDVRLFRQRRNLERFGVRSWQEAFQRIVSLGDGLKNPDTDQRVREARQVYNEGISVLETYGEGKYRELAPFIINIPEVYGELLKGADSFKEFLAHTLDLRLADFMTGCRKAGIRGAGNASESNGIISGAVRKQYAHMYIRSIYEGSMTGDETFFKKHLENFQDKLFNLSPAGGINVNKAMKKAEEIIDSECKKTGITGTNARLLKIGIMSGVMDMTEDTDSLAVLTDEKKLTDHVTAEFSRLKGSIKENEKETEFEQKIRAGEITKFRDQKIAEAAEVTAAKEKIRTAKEKGITDRLRYLGVNDHLLQEIRQGKTLVRVAMKGDEAITLDRSRIEKMRGRVDRYCDELNLPQVLKDALIERGAVGGLVPDIKGTFGDSELLYRHALAMSRMLNLLRTDKPGDPGMSDEEAQMYIVRSYGNAELIKQVFDRPEKLNIDEIRKSDDYMIFRSNYKKLMAFEEIDVSDPSLSQEKSTMSRNLRTMLITDMGSRDEQGRTADRKNIGSNIEYKYFYSRFGTIIDRNTAYADYWEKVMRIIRPKYIKAVQKSADPSMKKEFSLPEHYIDRQMSALRQYFMPEVIEKLKTGEKFDAAFWEARMQEIEKKEFRSNLEFDKGSVFFEELKKKEQNYSIEGKTDESAIASLIKANTFVFKGRFNKYEALDPEQKELFALALMLMEKGSIGLGTEGTMALTASLEQVHKDTERIRGELQKYVEGREYHFNVDYREAVNKLINYGISGYGQEEYTLSVTAYEKAMKFAKTMSAKKQSFGKKDMERMADGYSSLFTAYTKFDKKNITYIDALKEKPLNVMDVKEKLMSFARNDQIKTKAMIGNAAVKAKKSWYTGPLALIKGGAEIDKERAWDSRLNGIIKRIGDMNAGEMRLFVRLLQERTVIDESCIKDENGGVLHVDQKKRNALLEALSADPTTSGEVMEGFDDSTSCLQALTTALSFRLRDDRNFLGKDLTRDCYESDSFNRKTVVDWKLMENALALFDEVKSRRIFIESMRNPAELIKNGVNEKASAEYKKFEKDFEKKEDFKRADFEEHIRKQAKTDNRDDIDSALAGYHSLTDKEKILFFKVLGKRDLLDISKKDYKKSFFGITDRDYVNQAGRDRLIDEYIDASRDENIGLELEEDEVYKAMQSLFTTQIDDRIKLSRKEDIKKVFATERNLFFGRNTAVDWKLFKRALNFVNRASEELDMTEGNALLYRGAGNLSKNGRMNMNYSFLRKNFHRTGNQWARYFASRGARLGKEELYSNEMNKKYKTKDVLKFLENDAVKVTGILGFEDQGFVKQGPKWIRQGIKNTKANADKAGKNLSQEKIIQAPTKVKTRKRAASIGVQSYDTLRQGIDDIIAQGKSAEEITVSLKDYLSDNLLSDVQAVQQLQFTQGKAATVDKDNIVEHQTEKVKDDNTYGDIRDDLQSAYKTGQKIKKTVPKVEKAVKKISGKAGKISPEIEKYMGDFVALMDYASEKMVYRFINDKFIGADVEKKGFFNKDEYDELQKHIKQYVSDVFEGTMNEIFGKENTEIMKEYADKIYDFRNRTSGLIKTYTEGMNYVWRTTANVKNIASCAANIRALSEAKKQEDNVKAEDEGKLQNALSRGRLDDAQLKKAQNAAAKNKGLSDTAASISKAIQGLGIAKSAVNMAVDTAKLMGSSLMLAENMVSMAINEGLEFAHFAVRVITDRNALRDYYIHTEAGKQVVDKIKGGYLSAMNIKLLDQLNKASDEKTGSTTVVDMISDARGYEHTSELVENTGMSMAQSIVFSASDYNPMAESKIMAVTVMTVMGLEKYIGNTSPEVVQKLFDAFRMSR